MRLFFQERQTFTQWWLWLIVGATTIGINALFVQALVQQILMGIPWGDSPFSDETLVVLSVVVLSVSTGLSLLFFVSVMEVRIDNHSIEYRYMPLIRDWKRIEREVIRDFKQRRSYTVGHGVKRTFNGTRLLSVKGTQGVELTLDGGDKIFFGTQQPEQFLAAIDQMVKRNVN
jgi:hypothetical protein